MFFSVITICKNNLEELKRTYSSLNSQEHSNYEWIIIDGNSSDGTKDWLINTPVATKWKSEPDNGIYDAMNKGISLSGGKYLIFMNSGDCFENNSTLSNCQLFIEQNNSPGFVYGDSVDIAENGTRYYRKAKNHLKNWKGMITQHQAMFFNKELLADHKYPEEFKLSGDYAFISAFLKKLDSKDILYINSPICKFSMGGLNEIKRFNALDEDYKIRKDIIKLPLFVNSSLYFLHFVHTLIKKSNPSFRFLKHRSIR